MKNKKRKRTRNKRNKRNKRKQDSYKGYNMKLTIVAIEDHIEQNNNNVLLCD